MNKQNKNRPLYTDEFKMQAIKLVLEGGKSAAKVGRELGVYENTVRTWVKSYKEHKDEPFVGKGNLHKEDKERKEYEKVIRELREENEILKKAAAIFARAQNK